MSFSYNTTHANKSDLIPYLKATEEATAVKKLIPSEFDGRVQWRNLIVDPLDQGTCQACWAFAAVSALSDRFNIQSTGQVHLILSPTRLILCAGVEDLLDPFLFSDDSKEQAGCSQGNTLLRTCQFLHIFGTFENSCLPSDRDLIVNWPTAQEIKAVKDKSIPGLIVDNNLYVYPALSQNKKETLSCRSVTGPYGDQCDNNIPTNTSKITAADHIKKNKEKNSRPTRHARHWRISAFYTLKGVTNIQYDIFRWGTVLTSMQVTDRFMNWISSPEWSENSVYIPSTTSAPSAQSHSICLVGWGRGIGGLYWIVKNSWKDRSYFRYGSLENAYIESNCIGLVPDFFVTWKRIRAQPIVIESDINLRNIADGKSATYMGKEINVNVLQTIDSSNGYSQAAIKEARRKTPFNYCEFGPWSKFVAGSLPKSRTGLWLQRLMNCFTKSQVQKDTATQSSTEKDSATTGPSSNKLALYVSIISLTVLMLLKIGLKGKKFWNTFARKGIFTSLIFLV